MVFEDSVSKLLANPLSEDPANKKKPSKAVKPQRVKMCSGEGI